jgi:hypothetical protein
MEQNKSDFECILNSHCQSLAQMNDVTCTCGEFKFSSQDRIVQTNFKANFMAQSSRTCSLELLSMCVAHIAPLGSKVGIAFTTQVVYYIASSSGDRIAIYDELCHYLLFCLSTHQQ